MSEEAQTVTSDVPWVRRERWPLTGVVGLSALVVVLASTLLIRSGTDDPPPRAEVGEVMIGPPVIDDDLDTPAEIVLPWARMEARVSAPMQALPRFDEERTAHLLPPAGGSFIQVSVDRPEDFAIPLASTGVPFVGKVETVLTAGGRDYPLNSAGFNLDADAPLIDFGGTVWIAVEGQPSDAALSITVDGDTQVLADGEVSGGRSSELANIPTSEELGKTPEVKCGRAISVDTDGLTIRDTRNVGCSRKLVIRTPYVDGLGWAEPGRDFLVVHLASNADDLRLDDDTKPDTWWYQDNEQLTVTLDGQPSLADVVDVNTLATGPTAIQDSDDPRQYIFDVASDEVAGDLALAYTADVVPGNPFEVDPRRFEVRWRMPSADPAGASR